MPDILDTIKEDIKTAMKARDTETLSTLRMVHSSIKNQAIDLRRDLTDEEVVKVLKQLDELVAWAKSVQSYALESAIQNRKQWPGMKLVAGRGSRKYVDEDQVTKALLEAGISEEIVFKKAIQPHTQLQKTLKKEQFNELVSPHLKKIQGKAKLVEDQDERQTIQSSPEDDFKTQGGN